MKKKGKKGLSPPLAMVAKNDNMSGGGRHHLLGRLKNPAVREPKRAHTRYSVSTQRVLHQVHIRVPPPQTWTPFSFCPSSFSTTSYNPQRPRTHSPPQQEQGVLQGTIPHPVSHSWQTRGLEIGGARPSLLRQRRHRCRGCFGIPRSVGLKQKWSLEAVRYAGSRRMGLWYSARLTSSDTKPSESFTRLQTALQDVELLGKLVALGAAFFRLPSDS
jgi:hypothetical protein